MNNEQLKILKSFETEYDRLKDGNLYLQTKCAKYRNMIDHQVGVIEALKEDMLELKNRNVELRNDASLLRNRLLQDANNKLVAEVESLKKTLEKIRTPSPIVLFSVNEYDRDGDSVETGIFLHFGDTRVHVANTREEFKTLIGILIDMENEIAENYPEME